MTSPASERVPEMLRARVAKAICCPSGECRANARSMRLGVPVSCNWQGESEEAHAAIAAIRDHLAENFSMDKSAITLLDEALR